MEIKNIISNLYPTVHPFDGVHSIEEKLLESKYLVVMDDNKEFRGILTSGDVMKRPHKIVIDCLTEKEPVSADETMLSALDKFSRYKCSALPVFQGNRFIGIVEKYNLINELKNEINELYDKSIISQKVKSSFLTNLAHEVRTPLNGLLGFIELISGLDAGSSEIKEKEYYDIIRKSADRFLLIMNDLIDLARIHTGEDIGVEKEMVRIESIFTDLKEYFEAVKSVLNRNVSVRHINPDPSLVIFSDRKKIRHILYHLIDNAIKFSNDNQVTFGYKTENRNIVFFVTNKGAPMDENKKKKLFDAFEKQDTDSDDFRSGLGIGLPLIKKLSELLGGKIDLVSDETRTSFFFTLPSGNENLSPG